jgi:hypothetical protein
VREGQEVIEHRNEECLNHSRAFLDYRKTQVKMTIKTNKTSHPTITMIVRHQINKGNNKEESEERRTARNKRRRP